MVVVLRMKKSITVIYNDTNGLCVADAIGGGNDLDDLLRLAAASRDKFAAKHPKTLLDPVPVIYTRVFA